MNHWPSFERFGDAGDSGQFLALSPSVTGDDEPVTLEAGVEAEAPTPQSPVAPAVDPAEEAERPSRTRTARFSPLLLVASLAVHAAALVLTAHFLTQPGVEAETDAVSVEIVVDATPNPNTDPSLAGEAAVEADKAEDRAQRSRIETEPQESRAVKTASPAENKPEAAKPTTDEARAASKQPDDVAITVPAPAFSLPPSPPDIEVPHHTEPPPATAATEVPAPAFSLPATPPTIDTPKVLATPQAAEIQVLEPTLVLPKAPPKLEVLPSAPMTPLNPEAVTKAVPAPALKLPDAPPLITEDATPTVALPDEAPLPTPAPGDENPVRKAETAAPPKEPVKAVHAKQDAKPAAPPEPDKRPPARAPKQDRREADRSSSAGVSDAVGRGSVASRGGASAGEKAAYAARLNSHVQRFERYPADAERQGITGSARILITIDRDGRLISSRLAGSSGSAILDEAARATASRASPYPAPPDGIGGRTLTFAATIRFRR
jgi:protein TonB